MQMIGLKPLYNDMLQSNHLRSSFLITYNEITARVLYLIDTKPHLLMICIMDSNLYFELKVQPGFNIDAHVSTEIYHLIVKSFQIQYSSKHKYSPKDFLTFLNERIPDHLSGTVGVQPSDILRYKQNIEEPHKPYFWRFLSHAGTKNHVTIENLEKTRILLGEEAYERCKKCNISTQWSSNPQKNHFVP